MRRLAIVPLLIGLGLALPVCLHVLAETDLGWHLALGRHIADHGIPFTNALSWTAPDQPWYPTSWLYDVIVFQAIEGAGPLGVQLVTFGFVALTLVGAWLSARRLEPVRGPWLIPLLALMLLPRITERPHVATWAVLAFVTWLCLPAGTEDDDDPARFDRTFRRRLMAIPFVALGSNLHSGAAFAAIVLGLFSAEAWLLGGRKWRELAVGAGGVVALAANPGGAFNVRYVIEHLEVQNVIELGEFLHPTPFRAPGFFLLIPLALVAAWPLRRRSPAILAMVATFAFLGWWALRMVYDFEIVAVPVLAIGLARPGVFRDVRVVVGAVVVLLAITISGRVKTFERLEIGQRFDERVLPVRAAQFIDEAALDGRMFNAFRDGGYLEYRLPHLRWFQDARVQAWEPAFFAAEQEAEKSAEAFRAWLAEWDVEWAVLTRVKERLSGRTLLHDAPAWALVYRDGTTEVFVRRDVERFAKLVERAEYRLVVPWGAPLGQLARTEKAALPRWREEIARFEAAEPGTQEAAILRCGLAARSGEAMDEPCARAASMEQTPEWKALVNRAARIRPAD